MLANETLKHCKIRLASSENGSYKKYTCQLSNTRVLFIDRKSKELNKNKIAAELTRASNGDITHINGNGNNTANGLASFVDIDFSDVAEIRSLHPTKKHHIAQLRLHDGQSYYLKVRDQYWINSLRDLIGKYKQRLSNTIEPYYTPPNNNQCLWDNLPDELIVRVFYCLSVSDVPYFGVTCRRIKSVSWTNSVWRQFYKKKWDIKQVPAFNQEKSNWKAIYKQQCIIGDPNLTLVTKMAYHSILKAAQYNATRFNLVRELYQLRQDAPWQQMYNQQIKSTKLVPIKVLPLKKELLKLPPEIGNCTALERLELNELTLKEFPNKISKLARLKFLNISYCQFREFPTVICELPLITLFANRSGFTTIPAAISKLTNLVELFLEGNTHVTQLPNEISQLTRLRSIYLNRCATLTSLPSAMGELINLTRLEARVCKLQVLPRELGQLTKLVILDVTRNKLTDIPSALYKLTRLRTLQFLHNPLSNELKARLFTKDEFLHYLKCLDQGLAVDPPQYPIPKSAPDTYTAIVRSLLNVQSMSAREWKLNIPFNEIEVNTQKISRFDTIQIPELIGQCITLTRVDLSGYTLVNELPTEISQLTRLKILNMSRCGLTKLPAPIFEIRSLKHLLLNGNNFETIPGAISKLQKLEMLLVNAGGLQSLPSELCSLPHLKFLNLTSNQLEELPEELGHLRRLEYLHLTKNPITHMPKSTSNLRKLALLAMDKCKLAAFPTSICSLPNLAVLNLDYNSLATVPSSIGKLKSLHSASLVNCKLTSLPEELTQLVELTSLSLDHNQFAHVPRCVFHMKKLTSLSMRSCGLEEISPSISHLKKLTHLYLGRNRLTSLPAQLGNLHLYVFTVIGNPFTDEELMRQLRGGDLMKILKYLRNQATDGHALNRTNSANGLPNNNIIEHENNMINNNNMLNANSLDTSADNSGSTTFNYALLNNNNMLQYTESSDTISSEHLRD
jgi:Leucine-rich repeat (LRR) protein